jgi:hypothetical protein
MFGEVSHELKSLEFYDFQQKPAQLISFFRKNERAYCSKRFSLRFPDKLSQFLERKPYSNNIVTPSRDWYRPLLRLAGNANLRREEASVGDGGVARLAADGAHASAGSTVSS